MDVRPAEQRLIEVIGELPAGPALCNTAGRGQLAAALARCGTPLTCFFLDQYQLDETRLALQPAPANLALVCQPDPPPGEVPLFAWCFSKQGDSELARDLLQTGHERLALGGRMAVAVDNPADQWLHEQLRGLFDKVTRRPLADETVYLATKTRPLKKHKEYACEVAFRDGERLIRLRTRPGIFSHREVDGGARALIKAMQIDPGMRVLDIGCGSGAVGIAAALRAENVAVHAIDSNPRAIEAIAWAAEKNNAPVSATLDCYGESAPAASFDLALANPPYYSNFRIASLFIAIAHRSLASGGQLQIVTKTPNWHVEHLTPKWRDIDVQPAGHFLIVSAIKP